MIQCSLIRTKTGDDGTFGLFQTPNQSFFSGELPWRSNRSGVSCIPDGNYVCQWAFSPSHNRDIYHIMDVPNRTDCEIHPGNYCGDTSKGFRTDVKGCLLLGNGKDVVSVGFSGQEIVTESRTAISKFEDEMNKQDFALSIKCEGIGPFALS